MTETLDRDHATVVTTTNVSGVTNPHITKQRAGLTVWEVTPSVTAPTITNYDGQGRVATVWNSGQQLLTTLTYAGPGGRLSGIRTASLGSWIGAYMVVAPLA